MLEKFLQDIAVDNCNVQVCLKNKVFEAKPQMPHEAVEFFSEEDVYFLGGVDPKINKSRASDADILLKNYVFFDWDVRKDVPDLTDEDICDLGKNMLPELLATLEGFKNWRYIVFTGNGLHVYYFSEEPLEVKDKHNWKMGMKECVEKLNQVQPGFDEACINLARIARLPGTFNHKGEKKEVKVINFQDVYSSLLYGMEDRGKRKIEAITKAQEERTAAASDDPDDMFKKIEALPVGEVVAKVMVWEFDGRNFCDPGSEKKKACFVSQTKNILVHGGSDHLPNTAEAFGPFTFVRDVKKLTNKETFFWFKDNYPALNGAVEKSAIVPTPGDISNVFTKLKNSSFQPLHLTDKLDEYKFVVRGAVTRIGAMSFTGKSKYAYFLTHLLTKNDYHGIIISTEVPSEMVLAHLLMITVPEAKDIWDIMEGRVDLPIGIEERYRNLDIFDVKDTKNRLEMMEELLKATTKKKLEAGLPPPAFMVIDFVQMIMPKSATNSEFHAASRYAQEIQEMAQRHNIAIIDTSQLNSAGIKDLDREYGVIPFRNSADLYNNADIAIMLKRNRDPDSISNNNMLFSLRKHKYGKPVELDMEYNYTNGSFQLIGNHDL